MAKVKVHKIVNITLELTEDEAHWLKETVQNPFTDLEYSRDKKMRAAFWNALKNIDLP